MEWDYSDRKGEGMDKRSKQAKRMRKEKGQSKKTAKDEK